MKLNYEALDSVNIGNKAAFFKIIINDNDRIGNKIDEFKKYNEDDISSIFYYMEQITNGELLPSSKFRKIKGNGITYLYELKKNKIRFYCIEHAPNFFLIFIGEKGSQRSDIAKVQKKAKDIKSILIKKSK